MSAALVLGALVAGCAEGSPDPAAPDPGVVAPSASTAPSSSPPAAAPSAEPTTSAPAAEPGQRIEVTVTGREVSPPPDQVDLPVGETLTLVVTADADTILHAHGFEVEVPVVAGEPTEIALEGTTPGVYEVETHDPDLLLLQVAVR